MPIRPEYLPLYPDDWDEISRQVRFDRAGGRCESCRRPHGQMVFCLIDGRWLDLTPEHHWRDGHGVAVPAPTPRELLAGQARLTRVILATAHKDHDPRNRADTNLAAWCNRCHMMHDRPHHERQRWLTYRRRRASGDLFLGAYDLLPYPYFDEHGRPIVISTETGDLPRSLGGSMAEVA